ncbi:MAG: hypothetical protein WDA47_00680 [Bacilli bacterium]
MINLKLYILNLLNSFADLIFTWLLIGLVINKKNISRTSLNIKSIDGTIRSKLSKIKRLATVSIVVAVSIRE